MMNSRNMPKALPGATSRRLQALPGATQAPLRRPPGAGQAPPRRRPGAWVAVWPPEFDEFRKVHFTLIVELFQNTTDEFQNANDGFQEYAKNHYHERHPGAC